jgi:hypothetical protein
MTYRVWTEVVDDPAARHLVVARLEPKAADEPTALLAALIEGLHPIGDFALLTRCEEAGPAILCAFSHPDDAYALAAAVDAVEIDDHPEWASRCGFSLDKTTARAIADAIEANITEPAPPPHVAPTLLPANP